jgi:hypothetical protein
VKKKYSFAKGLGKRWERIKVSLCEKRKQIGNKKNERNG